MGTSDQSLPKIELGFYFISCVSGIFYCTYQFYLAGAYFDNFYDVNNDFTRGWSWVGRKKDISDHEWSAWIPFFVRLAPWVAVQLLISHIIKYKKLSSTVSCSWYIAVTLGFLWTYIGTSGVIFMMIQPCVVCLLISIRNLPLIYFVELGFVFVYQHKPLMNLVRDDWLQLDNEWNYLLTVTIFWVQLRSVSCAVDNITGYRHRNLAGFFRNFIETTAYCLYLPTLCTGPFFLYADFRKGINGPNDKWTLRRVATTCFNLLRFIFWLLFTEFSMHFLYITAFKYQARAVESFNSWTFYGFGYLVGQYFYCKYLIVYGLAGELTRADDINAPPPPKCISAIPLYSELWRDFDRGLYQFLIKYIYGPLISYKFPLTKLIASFLTFGFIYIWHGLRDFVLVWTLISFAGVTIESIARFIGKSPTYIDLLNKYLSPHMIRRLNCLMTAHLFIFTVAGSYYFRARMDIGNQYMYRFFHDPLLTKVLRTFFVYCGCQVSVEIKNYQNKKIK
ncbi:protein-cysteine N-palmitoyltransferase HHAT-like [Microplitis mediator]|uniref:protein-cysteine N-palmitoyltransferase HHAT-like n=1 Tax=Microplitis mediator TaxID=375433 RepID=UPI0025575AF6|nr:protein-cysteine N-palmitoyltransferase HHAT-like [Microplitis mediator]